MTRLDRRTLLGLGASLPLQACLLPDRPGPAVHHPVYPLGAMPGPRGGPGRLFAGAAAVDITPPEGAPVMLAGYGFDRPMHRVHDRLSARAVYLDDGRHRVALVVADVVGLLAPAVQRVRRLVGNGVRVVVASTHNHQSPDTMGYWGQAILHAVPSRSGIDVGYQRVLEQRLAAAIGRAAWRARPARLAFTRAPLWPGAVKNLRNPDDVPSDLLVAELRAPSGATIATIVNFGCHPETLGPRAHLLSADFPGPLRARLEARRGGTAVFVNGALGGMLTPHLDDGADLAERLSFVRALGHRVADDAADAIEAAAATRVDGVAYDAAAVELAIDNPLYTRLEAKGLVEARRRGPKGGLATEVGRLALGPIGWAVMPGEPTPAVGRLVQDVLRAQGVAEPAVIGLGNDELGYLMTEAQFDDSAFSYEVSVSPGRSSVPALTTALEAIQSKRSSRVG